MKYMCRVTKYNPKNRNTKGVYSFDEWTSYSDIGKCFNGITLTITQYKSYEKSYIETVLRFMECNKIDELQISCLEIYEEIKEFDKKLIDGMILSIKEIKIVIKYILREKIWCKLVFDDKFYVHFGYDFNMYIGSSVICEDILKKLEKSKLFIEEFESPYLESE